MVFSDIDGNPISFPLAFAVVSDPMEEETEDGGRDYEILETDIHGVMQDGVFICPFDDFATLEDFLASLLDYVRKASDGSIDLMEMLNDDDIA